MRLVECFGQLAIDYLRRPDVCISQFNCVGLTIVSSHHAGLTEAEPRLAATTSAVIDAHGEAEQRSEGRPHGRERH